MLKAALFSLLLRINTISDRTALHEYYRVMTILSCWCCGQTIHIFRVCIFENRFKVDRRNMVTFVNNNHPIVSHILFHFVTANKRLHDGNIHNTVHGILSGTENTNGRPHLPATSALLFLGRYYVKLQKAFERLFPLCHQSLCMYENQGVRFSLPDHIRGNDSLTERRCCR